MGIKKLIKKIFNPIWLPYKHRVVDRIEEVLERQKEIKNLLKEHQIKTDDYLQQGNLNQQAALPEINEALEEVVHYIYQQTKGDIGWNFAFAVDVIKHPDRYGHIYEILSDNESKRVFLDLIKHRMTFFVKDIEPFKAPCTERLEESKFPIPKMVMENDEPLYPYAIYFLEQYTIPGVVEAQPNDIVIDAGAYVGDSAIYFSQLVGDGGKVYGFEANPRIAKKRNTILKRIRLLMLM